MAEMPRGLYGLPVSFGARALLALLWSYAGSDAFVWPSRRRLAGELGVDPRSLRRMLRKLEEVGAIEEGRQRRGRYVREGWWLIAEPSGLTAEVEDGGEVGDQEEGDVGGRAASADPAEPCPDGDLATSREDRTVRSGPTGPGSAVVQRTDGSAKEDRTVRGGGPTGSPRRTVRSPRVNQEPPGTNHRVSEGARDGPAAGARSRTREDDEPDVEDELRKLARWRKAGGDPDGLGPWPEPTAPNGTVLPRLAFRRGDLRARLSEGHSAVEVHRAVHGFAGLVEAKVLKVEDWRAPYCFSGFFDGLLVEVRQREQRQALKRRHKHDPSTDSEPPPTNDVGDDREYASAEVIAEILAESETTTRCVRVQPPPDCPRRKTNMGRGDKLLDVRIEVQAVADTLGAVPH